MLDMNNQIPPQGDAEASDVVAGKTFQSKGSYGKKTGTIASKAGSSTTAVWANSDSGTEVEITVPAGYYPGGEQNLSIEDDQLLAANIAAGTVLFGVTGSFSSDADAASGDIVTGKTAYVGGVKLTGTLEPSTSGGDAESGDVLTGKTFTNDNGEQTGSMVDYRGQTIPFSAIGSTTGVLNVQGTLDGRADHTTIVEVTDTDFTPENIKDGVSIFGLVGTYEGATGGDAGVGDVLAGKTFTNDSGEQTGTMEDFRGETVSFAGLGATDGQLNVQGTMDGRADHTTIIEVPDADFVPANIKDGVSIFGLTGTLVSKQQLTGSFSVFTGDQTLEVPTGGWTPKYIFIEVVNASTGAIVETYTYNADASTTNWAWSTTSNTIQQMAVATGGGYVNSTGFKAPFTFSGNGSFSKTHRWMASE
jgi:hypothetical protein